MDVREGRWFFVPVLDRRKRIQTQLSGHKTHAFFFIASRILNQRLRNSIEKGP